MSFHINGRFRTPEMFDRDVSRACRRGGKNSKYEQAG
jgi:hypothetical protein